jgi:glycosyltransferase involved in cell wall biosynthesis
MYLIPKLVELKGIFLVQNRDVMNFDEFEKPISIRSVKNKRQYDFKDGKSVASVILVNYNHGHYLAEAINSVINQTYPNIEIIVIDGGSIDNSKTILQSYQGVKWISEPDNNSGHAFAKGVQLTTGSYVFFLTSSDGFFDNEWIETAVELLQNYSDLAMVSADVVGVRQNSVRNGYKWPEGVPAAWTNKKLFFNWLFHGTGVTPITFGIRKEILEQCAPSIDQLLDLNNPDSADYFWFLIGKFFNSGYIGIKIAKISSFVRFHNDRIEDGEYLPRQRNLLHRVIVERRRRLIFSMKPAVFISPLGEIVQSERILYIELVAKFILAKFLNLFGRLGKNPFDVD